MKIDKRASIIGQRRIPEVNLLVLGALGGGPLGLLARYQFRHKTRKSRFFWVFICGSILDAYIIFELLQKTL